MILYHSQGRRGESHAEGRLGSAQRHKLCIIIIIIIIIIIMLIKHMLCLCVLIVLYSCCCVIVALHPKAEICFNDVGPFWPRTVSGFPVSEHLREVSAETIIVRGTKGVPRKGA